MNYYQFLGFICSLLLISLTGVCLAEELPGKMIYVQGGESSIADGSEGVYTITIKDIVPYVHINTGGKSSLLPVQFLTNKAGPLNAALVLSGADNEKTYMVEVTNLSLSNENSVLTLVVKPLEFYEGEVLTPLEGEAQDLDTLKDITTSKTGLYLETTIIPESNGSPYDLCMCACKVLVLPGDTSDNNSEYSNCCACCQAGKSAADCAGGDCPYPWI